MVSDASKKKAAQKKAAAAAKRGGKTVAAASSKSAAASDAQKLENGIEALQISDRTCTGVLCSHPLSRDIRVSHLLIDKLKLCVSMIPLNCFCLVIWMNEKRWVYKS
jgi:ATP-binding cassette subfamily F protein 2